MNASLGFRRPLICYVLTTRVQDLFLTAQCNCEPTVHSYAVITVIQHGVEDYRHVTTQGKYPTVPQVSWLRRGATARSLSTRFRTFRTTVDTPPASPTNWTTPWGITRSPAQRSPTV